MSSAKKLRQFLHEHAKVASRDRDSIEFDILLHSNDHEPPHLHLSEDGKEDLCRILIPSQAPREIDDVVEMRERGKWEPKLTNRQKKVLLSWFGKKKVGVANFLYVTRLWADYHQ